MNKEKFYSKEKLGSYFIDKQGDTITVLAKGHVSPFEYLSKILDDVAKFAKNEDHNIFIDTLLYLGDTTNHVIKTEFTKSDGRLHIDKSVRIALNQTPEHVQNILAQFYLRNVELLEKDILFTRTRSKEVLDYINHLQKPSATKHIA